MSRIGRLPVAIPAGVKVNVKGTTLMVEGPKGKLSQEFVPEVEFSVAANVVTVTRKNDTKQVKSYHGLYRKLLSNMVDGVSKGFSKTLIINGVGFKAEMQGKILVLSLGYSTDIEVLVPEGLNVAVDQNVKLTVTGIDREKVGEFACEIRKLRAPEPYKGKGIRYDDEHIKRKVGKSGVK